MVRVTSFNYLGIIHGLCYIVFMCYEEEEEYDHYEEHDPLHSEAHTNYYRLREDADSSANRIVVKYPLPIDELKCSSWDEDEKHPFYGVDWQRTYYRFKFREEKYEHRNVYVVDKEGYLRFVRNGNNGDKETPEEADKEEGWYVVNDHVQFRNLTGRDSDKEDDFYTGCITINRYFECDKEQGQHDIRIEFDLTFKDGKVINIYQNTKYICNIARHKIKEYRLDWKTWETSDKYKALEKYYWHPLDTIEQKSHNAVEKISTFFNVIINRVCGWCRFQKSRHLERY